ncbi:MAG: DUF6263 family protein [Gemmataceae bacterium]
MLKSVPISILLCLTFFPAPGKAQIRLSWKFKEGEKFYVERVDTVKLSADSIGKPVTQEFEATTVLGFDVVKVESDKITLGLRFEGARFKGEVAGGDAVTKLMDRLKGVSFTITMDTRGKVTSIKGFDEALKKLGEDKAKADSMGSVFNQDTIMISLKEIFGFLPDNPAKSGDKWSHFTRMPLGPYGFLQGDYQFVFKGVDQKTKDRSLQGQEIEINGKLSFDFPKDGVVAPGIKVAQAEFKSPNADQPNSVKGVYWFSAEAGRLIRSEVNIDIRGSLGLQKEDTRLTVNLEMKSASKTRLLDTNPLE